MVQKLDESKRYEVRYRLITQQNVMVSILRPENINLKYHCMPDLLCILCLDIVKTSFMYLGQTKLICEFKKQILPCLGIEPIDGVRIDFAENILAAKNPLFSLSLSDMLSSMHNEQCDQFGRFIGVWVTF